MNYTTELTNFDLRVHQLNEPIQTPSLPKGKPSVPIWQKDLLTLEEAAAYTGLGIHKLRALSNDENCDFVLWNGTKRLLKRKRLDKYLDSAFSV